MTRPMLPRLGAACGIVFPIAMFLAVGDGSHFTAWRAVAATWALVLALPFLAYLSSLLRATEGDGGWLSTLALVAGCRASCSSSRATLPSWRSTGTGSQKAPSCTKRSTTPRAQLVLCCGAVAAIALRERVLPRWVGIFAAVTAVALAVNAGFVYASFVPALLLFLLWTLVTSIVLLRRSPSTQPRIAYST
jgi:hypothetical protein